MSTDKKYIYQIKSSCPVVFLISFFFFTNADNVKPYLKSKVLKVKVA